MNVIVNTTGATNRTTSHQGKKLQKPKLEHRRAKQSKASSKASSRWYQAKHREKEERKSIA
jgi:hypothetical protein